MSKRTPPALKPFHPLVREWFRDTLGAPSAPQQQGWPAIASGAHTLILAPTGTGKTLAAFLWELNNLVVDGLAEPLANAVHILYVSPLKALNNDIQRNLERPLAELKERFAAAGERFPELRVAVRTGDTPASARARMIRKSPHILITTPESLHIMLTSVRGRGMFSAVRAVIVDEIHAIAGSKRGVHLALTLERLERLCERSPQRIGLSATQRPLEEIARFLGGCLVEGNSRSDERSLRGEFRDVRIVDCGLVKRTEIAIESPVEDLGQVPGGTIWPSVAPLVLRHVRNARTTIVFVNNRAQAERMAARINALAGEEIARPYHGSLSRERRFLLEGALKAGELRALVSTSSLELGIDIGSVDLVLQLQSPKRVATALQRVGRAGHTLDAVSRGVFVPTFRDDALETLAIARGMREGDVEPTRVVQNALDVLAQVIVATVSIDDDWTSEALFALVRGAYPYHALTRAAFDEVLAMLAGKYPSDVAAELDARIVWDRMTDRLTALRSARLVSVVNGGTIPDRGLYSVNLPDRTRLGELDEEFVHETRIGDVFQLGSSTWRVNAIEHDRVIVTPAPGAPARMPFWHGEYAARSAHLSPRVGALRRELAEARTRDDVAEIATRYESDVATAQSLVEYAHQQRAATRTVPDDRVLVVEHFRDETNAVRIVLHAPFGGRVNAPWGMALAGRVRDALSGNASRDRARGIDIQVQTTDDGIMLRLSDLSGPVPLDALRGLSPEEAERRVLEEVGGSSLFGARFRMNAARALLLPRGNPRRRMPLWLQRLKAQDLLQTVREYPSFPILVETYRDVLQDAFDMPTLAGVLRALQSGAIELREAATEMPSPFAASLQFGFVMDWMYADDTPRAEQRAAMLSLDRGLLDELLGGTGADEATLMALDELLAVRRGTAPGRRARTADELAVLLDRAGDLSVEELDERTVPLAEGRTGEPVRALLESGRIVGVDVPIGDGKAERRVILTEAYPRYLAVFGEAACASLFAGPALEPVRAVEIIPAPLQQPTLTTAAARRELLARFVALSGPVSVGEIRARYDLPAEWVERRLAEWTTSGKLVRGTFARGGGAVATPSVGTRWCSRRLLEQARRRELAAARRQIEAVGIAAFVHFLQRWQHLDPSTRLGGAEGTAAAVRQLYGIARPAEAWEREFLRRRVVGYDPEIITRLCATGEALWVGGSALGTGDEDGVGNLATLCFIRRGTGRAWIADGPLDPEQRLHENAHRVLQALRQDGASFFDDLVAATTLGARAVRDALRELVAAGLVTNDTVESLRQVIRWRPILSSRLRNQPDPTRWLPSDWSPSANRPIVQRRPNLRRLPKWRPPSKEGGAPADASWPGRWALVRTAGILGPETDESALAEVVARQWLDRYGVVARDWWRRERPAVSWRAIYRELKRLEFRGDVRRGYFVRGLAGAQFAVPSAVEMLRDSGASRESRGENGAVLSAAPMIVMAASDPANAYALPIPQGSGPADADADSQLVRRRSRGALFVTRAGEVLLVAEGRGRRVTVRPGLAPADVADAARALAQRLLELSDRRRDPVVESIDGVGSAAAPHAAAFIAAGFRATANGLRIYAPPV